MLEDIKEIAELEPSRIVHMAVFISFYTNCINSIVRQRSLTRTSASCTKTPIYRLISIQFISTKKFQIIFLFLFCFARTFNGSFLIYAFDNNCYSQIFTCETKDDLFVSSGTGENRNVQTLRLLYPPGTGIDPA